MTTQSYMAAKAARLGISVNTLMQQRNDKMTNTPATMVRAPRSLSVIAREIRQDWGSKMYFGAVPYVTAMRGLNSITDDYCADSGKSIVIYFLFNAARWRGETARRIKAELKAMLK